MPREKATILIVDDNITNLKAAMTYLSAYSYEIVTARNGEIGLERAEAEKPDLILLDIQMPVLDGFEACRRLKANPETERIPIIFMTATSDTASKVKGLEIGAVDYITKPFEETELLARVKTHINLYKLQENLEAVVQERTAVLQEEIAQRERLWQAIHQQNEQFRTVTQLFLENQRQNNLTQVLNQQFQQNLYLLANLLQRTEVDAKQAELAQNLQEMESLVSHMQKQTTAFIDTLNQEKERRETILKNPLLQLSNREREVMQLLVEGKSTNEIATLLTVAPSTVSTYRRRIMDKLDAPDIPSLIRLVDELGESKY